MTTTISNNPKPGIMEFVVRRNEAANDGDLSAQVFSSYCVWKNRIQPWILALENSATKTLRIDLSMRYNESNGELFPDKAVRTDVRSIYTHLTQPTEWPADWAGMNYTNPLHLRPGGIPSGRLLLSKTLA